MEIETAVRSLIKFAGLATIAAAFVQPRNSFGLELCRGTKSMPARFANGVIGLPADGTANEMRTFGPRIFQRRDDVEMYTVRVWEDHAPR